MIRRPHGCIGAPRLSGWRVLLSGLALFLFFVAFSITGKVVAADRSTGAQGPGSVRGRGDPAAGKAVYDRYCHYCHGRKGYGDGPVGTAITPHPADFVHDTKRMSKSDEKLFKSISNGVQRKIGGEAMAMPRWAGVLSVKQRWDVLSYVRELEREGRKREGLAPIGHAKAQKR